MKKYFRLRRTTMGQSVSPQQVELYRGMVIDEMRKMGATPQELGLLRDEAILNSIRRNRKPEDLAWAILQ